MKTKRKITGKQNNSSGCVVCGDRNELSMNTRFYELENGELAAVFRTEELHQGYPGRLHGGLAAAVLDETIGRALCITEPGIWAVTVELETRYRKPVPTQETLTAVARVTRNSRKLFEGSGEIRLPDGTVAVECRGKYMKMPIKDLVSESFLADEWYRIEEEDPEELEI